MTKVLFLDVDGVLNYASLVESREHDFPLCPVACGLLASFLTLNAVRVVVSSTWRLFDGHVAALRNTGILNTLHNDWRTEEFDTDKCRGDEIAHWLSRHPETTHYAILDDEKQFLPEQQPHFIHTSFRYGLRQRHVRALAKVLECKVPK